MTLQNNGDKIAGVIDLSNQPTSALKYSGLGKYDLQDRELKGMIEDILKKVNDSYSSYFSKTAFPAWEKGEFSITVQNYDIGKYTNGVLKLKGE